MTMAAPLCIHCGTQTTVESTKDKGFFFVECPNPDCPGLGGDTEEAAIIGYNTRPSDAHYLHPLSK